MKSLLPLVGLAQLGCALALSAWGQNLFLPGVSTGALSHLDGGSVQGPIPLPPDGKLNYTTIHIPAGTTLRFIRNAANTPVYLLASGDVTIEGQIDVSGDFGTSLLAGVPGPGGFAGGMPGVNGGAPGDGLGPGGGIGGSADGTQFGGGGAYAGPGGGGTPSFSPRNGQTYGSQLLMPLVGGSGGGGGVSAGGGGGGGAILVASSTKVILNGTISAFGGGSGGTAAGGGSGGAVRLLAPTIEGTGAIFVNGNAGANATILTPNVAGVGRVRCDMMERSRFGITRSPDIAAIPADLTQNPPSPARLPEIAPFTIDQYLPLVFPPNPPTLRLVSIGGIAVPPGSAAGYSVTLPLNAPANQLVVIEASNFGADVPIAVKLTPTTGPALPATQATIGNAAADPASLALSLPFPPNVPVTVQVWTR